MGPPLLMRKDAEKYRQRGERGAGGGCNKSVSSCLPLQAQCFFSVSVLCIGLAEDLSIWVYVGSGRWDGRRRPLVFLSSWASHPIKKPFLQALHH